MQVTWTNRISRVTVEQRDTYMSRKLLKAVVYEEGKYFVAQCLNVDVSSFGDTEREALANLTEALELYFEDTDAEEAAPVERAEVVKLALTSA